MNAWQHAGQTTRKPTLPDPRPSYILTPHATEQFDDILYAIAVHGGWERSMRMEEKFYAAFSAIAANPGIGHMRTDLLPRRIFVDYAEPYHIPFLRDTSPIKIIAILHGARDIAAIASENFE